MLGVHIPICTAIFEYGIIMTLKKYYKQSTKVVPANTKGNKGSAENLSNVTMPAFKESANDIDIDKPQDNHKALDELVVAKTQ